jgi:hypothetical protein
MRSERAPEVILQRQALLHRIGHARHEEEGPLAGASLRDIQRDLGMRQKVIAVPAVVRPIDRAAKYAEKAKANPPPVQAHSRRPPCVVSVSNIAKRAASAPAASEKALPTVLVVSGSLRAVKRSAQVCPAIATPKGNSSQGPPSKRGAWKKLMVQTPKPAAEALTSTAQTRRRERAAETAEVNVNMVDATSAAMGASSNSAHGSAEWTVITILVIGPCQSAQQSSRQSQLEESRLLGIGLGESL